MYGPVNMASMGDSTDEAAHARASAAIRAGVVPYLNVQPLIWHLDHVNGPVQLVAAPPRKLAEMLRRGDVHCAVAPVFEHFINPVYTIVPGAAIACRGPVASVLLLGDEPLPEARRVLLDPNSLTSVHLIRILLAEAGYQAQFVPDDGRPLGPGEARVLIGDPALEAVNKYAHVRDLGGWWMELTGLPFVFAPWLVHPSACEMPLNAVFQEACAVGLANLGKVARERGPQFGQTSEAALLYLRDNIHFGLGDEELAGMRRFAHLCHRHGLIDKIPALPLHQF